MKTKKQNNANDGSIIAIQAIGPDGKPVFHPVTTIPVRNGKAIMVAVLDVLETVPAKSKMGRNLRDSLRVITPLADIYPELKAKLASIE